MFKILFRNHLIKYLKFKILKKTIKASCEKPTSFYLFFRMAFPFEKYNTDKYQIIINDKFNAVSKSGELEYLIKYDLGVIIEPNFGYALNNKSDILLFSLPYGDTLGTPFPNYIYYKRKKIIHLNQGVSIYYNWFNYWHFHNDVIGQLYLLDKENFPKEIPIIVPERALNLEYVKFFLTTDFSKKFRFLFQKSFEYYSVKEVYFCKSIPNISNQFVLSKAIFQRNIAFDKNKRRKIFLTRHSQRGRIISNLKELESLLIQNSFQIIDADEISFKEQIILFSESIIICGIHGAGLTNMLFRHDEKCTIIEIFPEDFIPVHYYWLAMELGFDYIPTYGSKLLNGEFSYPLDQLKNILSSSL